MNVKGINFDHARYACTFNNQVKKLDFLLLFIPFFDEHMYMFCILLYKYNEKSIILLVNY